MLKKLAVATLMLCAAGGALADTFNVGVVPSAPSIYYKQVEHFGTFFTDTFTFTVPDSALGISANVLEVLNTGGPGYASHISGLTYSIRDMANDDKGTYSGGLSVSRTVLAAGNYTLLVWGTADGLAGGTGTYGVNMSISPVPEPATYGMMLVGLGLLGFASRRRDASNDKFK